MCLLCKDCQKGEGRKHTQTDTKKANEEVESTREPRVDSFGSNAVNASLALANKQTSSSPLGGNSGRKVEKKEAKRKEEGKKEVSNKDAEQQEQQTGHTSGLSGSRRCRRHFCVAVAVVSLF